LSIQTPAHLYTLNESFFLYIECLRRNSLIALTPNHQIIITELKEALLFMLVKDGLLELYITQEHIKKLFFFSAIPIKICIKLILL
jgi:hypothetical protein